MRLTLLRILLSAALSVLLPACRSATEQAPSFLPGITLRGGPPDGSQLVLSDGTRWLIQPAGQSGTLRWRTGDPVQPRRSGHPVWPFLLVHGTTGVAALAKPVAAGTGPAPLN